MTMRHGLLILAVATSLGLAACKRGSEANDHATAGAPPTKGATGSGTAGTSVMGGPGSGLSGGLAPSGSASTPTGVAEGSANRTPKGSVGNR
jgi:hypothetical protein